MRTLSTRRFLVAAGTPSLGGHVIWDRLDRVYVPGLTGGQLRLDTQAEALAQAEALESEHNPGGDAMTGSLVDTELWEPRRAGQAPAGLLDATQATIVDTDERLIGWLLAYKTSWVRHRRAEQFLQIPAAVRWDALLAAQGTLTQPDADALVDALTNVISTHPNRRPVPCGSRFLPCQIGDGKTELYGIVDMWADVARGRRGWITGSDTRPMQWLTFEAAAVEAVQLTKDALGHNPIGIAQQTWQPSIVRIGDRISGTCVSIGSERVGHVTRISGPIRTPDCGGYRYEIITDAGRKAVVFAQYFV
jgi:hypothetical protein